MIKKCFIMITILLITLSTVSYADDIDEETTPEDSAQSNIMSSSAQKSDKPIINSRKYSVYDRKSGFSIYGKDENKQSSMASTTKIMTRNSCARKVLKP